MNTAPSYVNRMEAAKRWLGDRYLLARPINQPKPRRPAPVLPVMAAMLLTGCATMVKPGMTPDSKAADRYACEQEAYTAAAGNAFMLSNGLYRDCMRARGYR